MSMKPGKRQLREISGVARWAAARRARHQTDAVFVWIPKTAGTSIYAALGCPKYKNRRRVKYHFGQRGHVTFGHMSYADLWGAGYLLPRFHRTAFKFAFVRNPYARAVSLYTYFKKTEKLDARASFLQFCRMLESQPPRGVGLHNAWGWSQANPQMAWLEAVDVDFLGRVENLAHDFGVIQTRLGMPARVPDWLNRSNDRPVASYYCRETVDLVRHLYDADFRQLGYSQLLSIEGHASGYVGVGARQAASVAAV